MMEESSSQYLMWMRRKQVLKAHLEASSAPLFGGNDGNNNNNNNYCCYYSSSSSSWEERAFAEDAARILGAAGSTIWPPRSYSCTFCKREFRSAQALGGHMNVHRRDRARLKQNLIISPHHHHHNNNNNNNEALIDHHHHRHKNDYNNSLLGENCGEHAITTPRSSSIIWGQKMGSDAPSSEPAEENFNKGLLDCDDSVVETSLSVGLSSFSIFGQRSSPSVVPCGDDHDEAIISCKRLKTTITSSSSSSLPFCLKTCSKDRSHAVQSAEEIVLGLNRAGMEDLDLELRLGKQQKVK